ncbi:hypothetical protein RUND412_001537 [Rhizina undulata]
MAATITIVGSLNIDLVTETRRLPNPGETITAKSFQTFPGGKGANQAIAACRLSRDGPPSIEKDARGGEIGESGIRVKMIGAVGNDEFGPRLKGVLEGDGVDVTQVEVKNGVTTGVAVIIVEEDNAENRILVNPGANGTLKPSDFSVDYFANEAPAILILQLETPLQTILHLINFAEKASVPVLFNPAPAVPVPVHYYAKITYLILNETEAAILTGEEVSALDSEAGVKAAAETFVSRGAENVIITLGGRGAFWKTKSGEEGWVKPKVGAEGVVDTTGAGDTFVGGFAVKVVETTQQGLKVNIKEAVEWASRASGIAVGKRGAMAGIPWRSELV